MTIKQLRAKQHKERAAKRKVQREAARTRKQARVARRREKRAIKSAPKRSLKQWSLDVMERDNNCCVVCGAKAGTRKDKHGNIKVFKSGPRKGQPIIVPLNAHHLLDKNLYPEHKLKVICGVTLCVINHKYSKFSAHKGGLWFSEWLKINRPAQWKWAVEN